MNAQIKLVETASLKLHPLSLKIYGEGEATADLVESIGKHGILTPLTITKDNRIISGHRRFAAAKQLGLEKVPANVYQSDDELEIEMAVVEANVYREKDNAQKGREFIERKRIEEELAKRNMIEGGKKGGEIAGRGRPLNRGVEIFPQGYRAPLARERAATPLGWSDRTAEKAAKVIDYIEQTGDDTMTALLNKSVNSAYAAVKQKTGDGPTPPPFNPQYSNIWNFPRLTEGFGEKYPGNIPGDIIRNLIWYYTCDGDLIVDLFAGGGVTLDVCNWWNDQGQTWRVRHYSSDLVPSRKGIAKWDVTKPPYVPEESKGAGMIFLDPPYWKQKRGDYSAHETNLANLPLAKFNDALARLMKAANKALRQGGHLSVIIGATQDSGQFVDHTAYLLAQSETIGLTLAQRIIVPYTTQQFSAADVSQARKSKMMLKGYRDLLVLRKES